MKQFNTFKQSIKLSKEYWKVLLLDITYYIVSISLITLWVFLLSRWTESLSGINLNSIQSLPPAQIEAISTTLSQFWLSLVVYSIFLVLGLYGAYVYFKGNIWSIILKKKLLFWRFTLVNVVWCIILIFGITILALFSKSIPNIELSPLIPLIGFLSMFTKFPYITIAITLLIYFITATLQISILEGENYFTLTINSLKKLHLYLLYLVFALIPLILVLVIGILIQFLPEVLNILISIISIILYITWLRYYFVQIRNELK